MISGVEDGVKKAIEATLDSLLIVFILVELLSAVRSAIADHELVAEPFLLVGILAAIKELVVLTTFRLEQQKTSDTGIKIGALAGVVIVLAFATFVLRRRQREPKESGD
jgi:LPXTG-motif cell wall-anchored protein